MIEAVLIACLKGVHTGSIRRMSIETVSRGHGVLVLS